MGDKYAQMRLLWELQNYFPNLFPEKGISPERTEAIIVCLIFFPVVRFNIEEDEVSGFSSMSSHDMVCIEMKPQQSSISLSLPVPEGPHPVHVVVHLNRVEEGEVGVRLSLCGEGKFSLGGMAKPLLFPSRKSKAMEEVE